MKIGSLCSGYGGLDMAVEAYYNAESVWMCDIDKYSSIVIKERWGLPNLGDLKTVDWAAVEPIDILTAGYPCQPFSTAGQRKGLNDERHIWPYIKEIISTLQPKRVILENVRGHLTLGFKEVLKDLTEIGYDARWAIVRASDVGAPHRRERLFVVAGHTDNSFNGSFKRISQEQFAESTGTSGRVEQLFISSQPSDSNGERGNFRGDRATGNQGQSQPQSRGSGSIVTDTHSSPHNQSRRTNRPISQSTSEIINRSNWNEHRSSGEIATDSDGNEQQRNGSTSGLGSRFNSRAEMRLQSAPNPLDINNKLNAKFVEYMMGLPVGWVTDLDISRSQQLKLLGNGVVPQQAYYAIDKLESL